MPTSTSLCGSRLLIWQERPPVMNLQHWMAQEAIGLQHFPWDACKSLGAVDRHQQNRPKLNGMKRTPRSIYPIYPLSSMNWHEFPVVETATKFWLTGHSPNLRCFTKVSRDREGWRTATLLGRMWRALFNGISMPVWGPALRSWRMSGWFNSKILHIPFQFQVYTSLCLMPYK